MARLTDSRWAENASAMCRRNFDAYAAADKLARKIGACAVAPYEFKALALEILKLDAVYLAWQQEFAIMNNITSIEADVVIECIAARLFGIEQQRGSSGEEKILHYLRDAGIKFTREKSFHGMRHLGALRFDFYLDDLGIAIEFHGIQHYELVGFFGGESGLSETIIRDAKKRKWCAQHKIRLIEIKYDQNPIDILTKELHGLLG